MPTLLRKYEENGEQIEKYTRDGETVSHTVRTLINDAPVEKVVPAPSIEEQILTETKYQTVLLEMNTGL